MKTTRNYLLLFVLFTSRAIANDGEFIRYFNDFYHGFSSVSTDESSYNRLVSFRVEPSNFINHENKTPEPYTDASGDPRVIAEKNEILFNGRTSKRFFLKYVSSVILSNGAISAGNNIEYKEAGTIYTFEVDEKNSNKVVLSENILFPVDNDNYSEYKCFYDFSKSSNGVIKLVDVFCAG